MNNQRRKAIRAIAERLGVLGAEIETLVSELETERDAEQDAFDAMPESLQGSERGERMTAAIEALEEVHSTLSDLDFSDLDGKLEEACE